MGVFGVFFNELAMKIIELTFTQRINAPADRVYDELADPLNMLGLQPLLTDIKVQDVTSTAEDRVFRYQTTESFRLFGLTIWKNRIDVTTQTSAKKRHIESFVRSPGGVTLTANYRFLWDGQYTEITERMRIQCPAMLANFVSRTARQVQQQTLLNLKNRLETR